MEEDIRRLISAISNRRIGLSSAALRIGAWAGLLLALCALSLRDYDSFQLGTWIDDATYVGLARALLAPDLRTWLALHPFSLIFPPGYPLILAPVVALFPGNLVVLKLLSLAATLLCATLLYWGWPWFAPGLSRRWTIAVTALFVAAPIAVEHSRLVMSEPVFMVLTLLALLLAERAARWGACLGPDLLLGALLTFSALVRSVGLVLVLVVLAYVTIRQGRRWWPTVGATIAGIIATVVLVVWLSPVSLADIVPGRYLTKWSAPVHTPPASTLEGPEGPQTALSDRFRHLFATYVVGGVRQRLGSDLDSLVFPVGGGRSEAKLAEAIGLPWLPRAIGYFVSGLIMLGFVACFARGQVTAFIVFGPVYLAATLIWVSSGSRLLYPILPQLTLAFLLGVDALVRSLIALVDRPALARARVPFLIVFVALLALLSVRMSLRIPDTRLHVGDLQARSNWLAMNAAPSDTLMSEAPAVEFAYSNRKTVDYPPGCPSPKDLTSYLITNRVDFVLVAPQILWRERYMPTYSERTWCILDALVALETERHAGRVFASEDGYLQVFHITYD